MSYQKEIRNHFENNKEKFFPGIEKGNWRNSENIYPHILPKQQEKLNLLEPYRDDLWQNIEADNSCLKRHVYFHHLNSSQAMCLNFFHPLIKERELDVVLRCIGLENETVNYGETCFEKKSKIEQNYRPTSFDFYIKTDSGKKIFFEIKYTERKFGAAKEDDLHINKFNAVYKEKLSVLEEEYHQPTVFFKNYQILRNLICIDNNSYVVFIYPDKNKKIKDQAESAKKNILKREFRNNLKNLTWEHLLDYSEENVKTETIKEQFRNFRQKYCFQK